MAVLSRLAAAARAALDTLPHAPDLERLWTRAALETIAGGRLVDPPLGEAKRLTMLERVWCDMAPWPAEAVWDRIGRLTDSQRLAIALGDAAWLAQLDDTWASAPEAIGELARLRARGEIALGLGRGAWSAGERDLLTTESFLLPSAPGDRAWRALAEHDVDAARRALAELEERMASVAVEWAAAPDKALRTIRAHPGWALGVEARALRSLL